MKIIPLFTHWLFEGPSRQESIRPEGTVLKTPETIAPQPEPAPFIKDDSPPEHKRGWHV
jgi:hypothetical protein